MYSQSITRSHRTAFFIALDLSGSMCEVIETPEGRCTKAEMVCNITNTLLFELIERARRSEGIRDYYDVSVIGYSGAGVRPLLGERWLVSIQELGAIRPTTYERLIHRRLPDGGEVLHRQRQSRWIHPSAEGETPMYELLCRIRELVSEWCHDPRNRNSFPPVVFNITDGEASDCDNDSLRRICHAIREEGTSDGGVLLLNIHLSSHGSQPAQLFPASIEELGENRYARLLYDCSSPMPPVYNRAICAIRGEHATGPFRGMSCNCSASELLSLLNIGTISLPIH